MNKIRAQRENFIYSGVSLKCAQVEVFQGQLGMFQVQYTVQVAPETTPYGFFVFLNDVNEVLMSDVL